MSDEEQEQIKELVIERLRALPSDREISIGDEGSFDREELMKHVADGDSIGEKIIEVELGFLKSLKEGTIYGA